MNTEYESTLESYAPLIMEHLPVGVALFDARSLLIVASNRLYQSLLGEQWQHGCVIGRSLTEILATDLPAEELSALVEIFRRVAETGEVFRSEEYAFSSSSRDMTYWNWKLDPIYEGERVNYLLLSVTDATSQVKARQRVEQDHVALAQAHSAAADEQQRLYAILDQLPEGILLVEARTSKVSYANPAAAHLLGVALPQFVGIPLNQSALMSPRGLSTQNQQLAFRWNFALIHALWGKTITNQELLVTRPDGSDIIVLSSVAPIRMPNGMISGAVIVFQDISHLKQLERQKDEFFAVANHELRTPLTIIMGFAELLHMRTDDNVDTMYRYATTSIMQECEHLLRLIHDLLDVSHLEHGSLKMKKSHQDLLAPLRQTVDKYIHTTDTHTLRFVLEDIQPTDLLMGRFDIPRIEQTFTNLITNAIKYSPVGSEVEVGIRPHQKVDGVVQEVMIWVKDQGSGIASNDLPHIFERFYQASDADRSAGGFGIGLYLTKELIRNHDGRIWVKSTKGRGSTFFVVLPLQNEQ